MIESMVLDLSLIAHDLRGLFCAEHDSIKTYINPQVMCVMNRIYNIFFRLKASTKNTIKAV